MGIQGAVIVLWFPDVDCQQNKGGFTSRAQGKGMG